VHPLPITVEVRRRRQQRRDPLRQAANKIQKLVPHSVAESNGMIYLWNSDVGQDPYWQPPRIDEFYSPDFRTSPQLRKLHPNARLQPKSLGRTRPTPPSAVGSQGSNPPVVHLRGGRGAPHLPHQGRDHHRREERQTWLSPTVRTGLSSTTWTYGLGFAFARFVDQDDSVHGVAITRSTMSTAISSARWHARRPTSMKRPVSP